MRRCIFVLGMHRSGTSAFMGTLSLLGVGLGLKLMKPNKYNPTGYFENEKIYKLNEQMIGKTSSFWDNIFYLDYLDNDWTNEKKLAIYKS